MDAFIARMKNASKTIEITASVCDLPSYISCFFPNDELNSILLVSEQDLHESNCTLGPTSNEPLDGSIAEISGNPLECHFNDFTLVDNTDICPINVSKLPKGLKIEYARSLLSIRNMDTNMSTPVWIVCNANDIRKTLLLCSYEDKGHLVCGWASGYVPIKGNPDLKSFLNDHEQWIRNPRCQMNWKIEVVYESVKSTQMNYSEYGSKFKLSWNHHLSFSPPSSSNILNASLVVKCKPGEGGEPLRFIWEQILILNAYYKCIASNDESNMPVSDYLMERLPKSNASASERLHTLLAEPILMNAKHPSIVKSLLDLVSEISSPDSEMGALGKFWYRLLECSTLKEVLSCLGHLDVFLSNKQSVSHLNQILQVTNTNVNKIPLRRLVEFGIEKLKNEIGLIFFRAKILCNASEVPMLGNLTDNDWMRTVQKSLGWLTQKICLLEQLVSTQAEFEIPMDSLHSLAPIFESQWLKTIDETRSIDWLTNNTLTLNCDTLQLTTIINLSQIVPCEWLMTVTSTEKGQCKGQSKFFISTKLPYIASNDVNGKLEDETLWSSRLQVFYH